MVCHIFVVKRAELDIHNENLRLLARGLVLGIKDLVAVHISVDIFFLIRHFCWYRLHKDLFSFCVTYLLCVLSGLLAEKHWSSEEHLVELESLGCLVLHKVNVHKMSYHHKLKHMEFDVVVFNFPHAGHFSGYTEKNEELIE